MKVLYQFTRKNLLKNKHRTLVTIVGVILVTILMFGIGLGFSTLRETMIDNEYRNVGRYHVLYNDITYHDYKTILEDQNVELAEYSKEKEFITIENGIRSLSIQLFDRNSYELTYFELLKGNYPSNENEIVISNSLLHKLEKNLNDEIVLNEKNYKIVGVVEGKSSMYPEIELSIFTNTKKLEDDDHLNVFVTFKNKKHIYDKIIALSQRMQLEADYTGGHLGHEQEIIHEDLLELDGHIRRYGIFAIMILCLMLILTVLGIASVLVIYNSFAISVTERKKMLGILSSIGATRWQLLGSVMIEATIIALIAIPIGFLLSIGVMKLLLLAINYMMQDINAYSYELSIYWMFLLVPTIFIIISVYLSAFFPSMRAFEITPLEAIRQNDDIKLNKRFLKGGKIIEKIFGIEAKIAYKNSKRNKKKYRITIISLVVSIVLFITFSTFFNYGFLFSKLPMEYGEVDVSLQVTGDRKKIHEFYDELTNGIKLKRYYYYQSSYGRFESKIKPEYEKTYSENSNNEENMIEILILRDSEYAAYLKKLKLKKEIPIAINYAVWNEYDENDITSEPIGVIKTKIYKNIEELDFNIFTTKFDFEAGHKTEENMIHITEFYNTNLLPDCYDRYNSIFTLILSEKMYHKYVNDTELEMYNMEFNTKDFVKIEKKFRKIENDYKDLSITYENPSFFIYQNNMEILLYKIVLYIFIFFVTVIALTSVINTIYTNIQLRKKEFMTLRSIGMTSKGFYKMMFYESLLFGLKSLFYGIVISLVILWIVSGIWKVIPVYGDEVIKVPFPTTYIVIVIIGVMIIVFATMFYSIRKLKSDNIMDTLKEESF